MILSLNQIENTTTSLLNIMCRFLSNDESNHSNESDIEFTDDSDSDIEDVCIDPPFWLALTDFDYKNFYLHELIPRFRYCMGQTRVFDNATMTVEFSFQDEAECALLFDYIYGYFGRYNYCPDLKYHDGDLVTGIYVSWLGGCLAECLLDPDGNVTNNVVCIFNYEYC